MAAACVSRLRGIRLFMIAPRQIRLYSGSPRNVSDGRWASAIKVTAVSAVVGYVAYKVVTGTSKSRSVSAAAKMENAVHNVQGHTKKSAGVNQREMTFLNFASVEYEGNVYMTPEDFLESITEDKPRPRTARRHLRQNDVEKWLKSTPSKSKGSHEFFRKLLDKGLISYTEYLFLLCVLTKPRSGFQIAFNMFDIDGDQRVDKKEFLVLMRIYENSIGPKMTSADVSDTDRVPPSIRANIWNLLQAADLGAGSDETELTTDTTLTVHFFGTKGKDVLTFRDFHRFMDNLQTEVLELEFNEFSHGMPTISEHDFARILLRYTILTTEAHADFLDRLSKRIPHSQGISFGDFKEFCQFLNNLDDFALAMRIYTYASQPISEADFQRAVKACTGQNLNSHLIHVVFQLFDVDGDGKLSHKEFVAVMKERLHRGTRAGAQGRWDSYKTCVKNEMKHN